MLTNVITGIGLIALAVFLYGWAEALISPAPFPY